jgi:hypothetical protein
VKVCSRASSKACRNATMDNMPLQLKEAYLKANPDP